MDTIALIDIACALATAPDKYQLAGTKIGGVTITGFRFDQTLQKDVVVVRHLGVVKTLHFRLHNNGVELESNQ